MAALAAATSGPLAKACTGISAIGIGAARCGIATFVILAVYPRATRGAVRALSTRNKIALAGAGLFLASHFAFFLGGLVRTSLPAAVALVSLEPLAVVIAAWIAFGIRPTRLEALGVIVAMVGAAWVARGAGQGENRLVGDLMVVVAVVLFGAYVASARGLRDAMPMMPYAAGVYGVSFLALVPFAIGIAFAEPGGPSSPPARTWVYLFALAFVPTLVGHTLVQRSARYLSPAVVAMVSPGETVGSIAIGALLQGAWPTRDEWIGAALVVAGASIAIFGRGGSRT